MADRIFDRAFNRVYASTVLESEKLEKRERQELRKKAAESEEAEQGEAETSTSPQDAIQRILTASKDKDYFRLMELPPPDIDELGRPAWSCTSSDISRAYRRISVLVHPDKNPGQEARDAFEALNEAHRLLRDPGQREEILKGALAGARERREAAEAAATLDERVALNAAKKESVKELRKQEGADFQAEIMRQLREKQERARRKRERQAKSRRAESDGEEEAAPPTEDAAGTDRWQQPAAKKRGKPKLIF